MKLLLTSGGLRNDSIIAALQDLLGKPFDQAKIVFIPTAANAERKDKTWLAKDFYYTAKLGWQKFDVVDPAVAPLEENGWLQALQEADVILVGGGNTFYLSYWLQKSGLAEKLPEMLKTKVYVGISAGSMITTRNLRLNSHALEKFGGTVHYDEEYDELGPKGQSSAKTLKLVNFVIRPHFGAPNRSKINDEMLQKIAPQLDVPLYALDDSSAIKVVDDKIDVISEGTWKLYTK